MIQLKLIRLYFNVLSIIAPKLAGKKAFSLFQKVRKKSIRPREKAFFDRAEHFSLPVNLDEGKDELLDGYRLGDSVAPLVFLVHGWDSNAGSLSQLAEGFITTGYRVVLFNLPGHAFYTRDKTNMLECGKALAAMIEQESAGGPFSLVSHSFGSAVSAYVIAKHQFRPSKLVFLTTPNRVEDIFTEFKEMVSLGDKAYQEMVRITEAKLEEPISNITTAKSLKMSTYDEVLLIHDKYDRILPFENSQLISKNIKNSTLHAVEKVGHYKMLWNEEVIKKTIDFISKH